ncbi:hypothetical protein MTO96_049967 [Rhipicephalus appendiculatus]
MRYLVFVLVVFAAAIYVCGQEASSRIPCETKPCPSGYKCLRIRCITYPCPQSHCVKENSTGILQNKGGN